MNSFVRDIRAILIPERKWHYIFHFLVMLVAASYWLGSLIRHDDATWAEIAIYRPLGDNQVYPVVTALSQFNFGDPTDALHHGEGTAGSQIIPLFPYAMAYAVFGVPGYMIVDVVLSWLYLIAITLLLRRCNLGNFSSLLVGTAIATRFLSILGAKIGLSFNAVLSLFGTGTWEWGIPNFFDLQIFSSRIPRPMGTEIFVVLLLYFLLRQWQERRQPSFQRGLAIGVLMSLLMQGDPFSLAALGLLLLWVMGWTLAANGWQLPWRFIGGSVLGVLSLGWIFLWQRFSEHPDSAVRFGLADYPREKIMFLPGYGPLLRVGIVCVLAGIILMAVRYRRKAGSPEQTDLVPEKKKKSRADSKSDGATSTLFPGSIEKSIATFFVALIVAAWVAQPIQLLLLGKGSQIYHYLIFVLPTLYAYAVIILLFNFFKLALPGELLEAGRRFGTKPQWAGATFMALICVVVALVGMENRIATVSTLSNARGETNVPWSHGGDLYRPCFRELEKQFRENPSLKEVRSIATFCYEVNFLLTGFYDKRAYLPDNAYSTLSDEQLEDRLLETLKIIQLPPENLSDFIQANFILNYWLGCAKYWMTSDYQYAKRSDYAPDQLASLDQQAKQSPWLLTLPISEMQRLSERYITILETQSEREKHPDAIIVGLEKSIGLIPDARWYREVYTNQLFSVYVKNAGSDLSEASVLD